jgi:hypothetical protein
MFFACHALWGELAYSVLTVADVLKLEPAEMMSIPTAFDSYVERTSSTCLISVARNSSSMSCERIGQSVSSRRYSSRAEVCR